ncbi:MAG: hypothetical protein EHM43_12030 [Ignavibacteriae bacterium]|nr:MAG: hypothetical protein EHM43_12030 [Ignavibacteriota bacterium]
MALNVPTIGAQTLLRRALGDVATGNLLLKLYTNDVTPAEGDTVATYTVASGNGYADKTLTDGSWTVTNADPAVATYDSGAQVFTFTGALGNVYGYYITDAAGTTLMWSERFTGAPFNVQNNGDTITVTLQLTLD